MVLAGKIKAVVVSVLDLAVHYFKLKEEIHPVIKEVPEPGWHVLGKRGEKFERELEFDS
ncbi:hypothetical protein ACFL5V_09910 [Fibrobacterota bacterium]